MARPKKEIDWDIVDKLLEASCEGTEVAAYIGVAPKTLYERCKDENKVNFSHYLQEKKAKGDTMLKVKQFESAVKDKNISMQIWLGKQRLGQKEKQEIEQKIEMTEDNLTDEELDQKIDEIIRKRKTENK